MPFTRFSPHLGDDMRSVQNARTGDLYAGHEGNVYRFHDGQWQRYEGNNWKPLESRSAEQDRTHAVENLQQWTGMDGEELRGHEEPGTDGLRTREEVEGRDGGLFGGRESVESLDREAAARHLGESHWNDFHVSYLPFFCSFRLKSVGGGSEVSNLPLL